jgi:hypothetical protein
MYPIGDDNGDVRSLPFATQFENLYNLINYLIPKINGDQTIPHDIPALLADAVYEGGSVDEYATHVHAISTKTAYIDSRDKIDLLPFNDILPPVNAYAPRFWTPRYDETDIFQTGETQLFSRDEYRHLACYYGVNSATADTSLEPSLKDKEQRTRTSERNEGRTRHAKTRSLSPRKRNDGVHRRTDSCNLTYGYKRHRGRRS